MFNSAALIELNSRHGQMLGDLLRLEEALNQRFFGMELPVRAMILAAMTGEAMVMIGPPGTSKSRLVRAFCQFLGLIDDSSFAGKAAASAKTGEDYFEYLLTQFTEPSELFGHYDLAKLFAPDGQKREFVRASEGMMQKAQVVFLDEVFNASSAILNALLTFMNEHKFHDRGQVVQTPLRLLFSATNHPPREDGLGAVFDRFLLRCRIENVVTSHVGRLVEGLGTLADAAWRETHAPVEVGATGFGGLMAALDAYRADVDAMTRGARLTVVKSDPLFVKLADMATSVTRHNLSQVSNRRVVKFLSVFLASSLLRAARTGAAPKPGVEDLELFLDYGLDQVDRGTVEKIRQLLRAA